MQVQRPQPMYNPHNLPAEFVFDQKPGVIDPIISMHLDLHDITTEFKTLVEQYELDPVKGDDHPRPLRTSKAEILSKTTIFDTLISIAKKAVNDQWIINGELNVSDFGFYVYLEGTFFPKHSDNGGDTDSEINILHSPHRKFTVLYYLEDSGIEYDGGELVISKPNGLDTILIEPKKCQMVIMPSNAYFRHSVLRITRGKRIMFAFFLDVKPI